MEKKITASKQKQTKAKPLSQSQVDNLSKPQKVGNMKVTFTEVKKKINPYGLAPTSKKLCDWEKIEINKENIEVMLELLKKFKKKVKRIRDCVIIWSRFNGDIKLIDQELMNLISNDMQQVGFETVHYDHKTLFLKVLKDLNGLDRIQRQLKFSHAFNWDVGVNNTVFSMRYRAIIDYLRSISFAFEKFIILGDYTSKGLWDHVANSVLCDSSAMLALESQINYWEWELENLK